MKNAHQLHSLIAGVVLAMSVASSSILAADMPSEKDVAKEKVIFQVSAGDPKTWNLALNNAKNVQQELGAKNVDIEIVAYGPGIGMLKFDSAVANRIDEAVADGVKVVACENTMKVQKLAREDMLSSAAFVPAGVVELMKKQKEGYAYIRP
ncbi:MAG: DsrE family protein [Sulfurimicrobium sp.]|nr:DsrE family protein [Sulfurimicrobium sp.]MDP2198205.1 DsrE family protein [Sulfurimicrobium sp.]MDP3686016.1 DsrE family protein [Sulfurimicrobium sp.]